MDNFLNIIFSPVNLVLTLLMLLLVIYWIFTMISGIDFDLDVDVDIDADIDTDFEIDTDTSIEGGNLDFEDIANTEINKEDVIGKKRKPLKWWQILLIYFNFVGLPFMFTFSAWIFIWWLCTTITTTITHTYNHSMGYVIFLAGIVPSLLLTKFFTTPFKSFFKNLNQDGDEAYDLIGRTGISQSTIAESKLGTAEIVIDKNPITIYIKSLHGEQINYKEKILIIKQSEDHNHYFVQSYND